MAIKSVSAHIRAKSTVGQPTIGPFLVALRDELDGAIAVLRGDIGGPIPEGYWDNLANQTAKAALVFQNLANRAENEPGR